MTDDLEALRDELDDLRATLAAIRSNITQHEDTPRRLTEVEQENRALRFLVENILTRLVKVERTVNAPGIVPQQDETVRHR
jgi:prefoldin subunit 5